DRHAALGVADDDEGVEAEAPAALDDRRTAPNLDDAFFQAVRPPHRLAAITISRHGVPAPEVGLCKSGVETPHSKKGRCLLECGDSSPLWTLRTIQSGDESPHSRKCPQNCNPPLRAASARALTRP